ncbi:MAG: hypothetical protein KC684_07130 [Candidatus Omnitrophica bacterium]|nr:hypothetical protein [Candidatus Omnitrophota bacterium]
MTDKREIYDIPFPEELSGEVVEGIDIQMVASDSLRLIDAFCKKATLSDIQLKVLKESAQELETIILNIDDLYKPYFGRIRQAVENILKQIKSNS